MQPRERHGSVEACQHQGRRAATCRRGPGKSRLGLHHAVHAVVRRRRPVFIAPLLVTLALKVNDLVGIDNAPKNLALITGTGSLLAMVSNPLFGRLSDRTTPDRHATSLDTRRTRRRHGGTLVVARRRTSPVVLVGWCIAQVFFNALLAAQAAVLPDQVPTAQRGLVSGVTRRLHASRISGRHLSRPGRRRPHARHVPVPCLVGGAFIVVFTTRLRDRRLDPPTGRCWSLRELAGSFYVNPRRNPDFAWAFPAGSCS